MSDAERRLDGVDFFLEEINIELRAILESPPTKPEIIAHLKVWRNHINTIKGIINDK